MTLTKSYRNNAFLSLLGFTFKKNLGFTLIAVLIALLIGPFRLIRELFLNGVTLEDYLGGYIAFPHEQDFAGLGIFLSLLVGVFFIFLILFNFSYLFKKSSSDAFHSFPLKRSELLLARFIPAFVLSLIPLLVGFAGEALVFAVCRIPTDYGSVLTIVSYIVSVMVLCGGFTLIFAVCSGTGFDTILLMFAIGAGIPLSLALTESFASELLHGYATGSFDFSITAFSSPYVFAAYYLWQLLDSSTSDAFGAKWYVQVACWALGIAFVSLSVYIYNRRKSEAAGTPYAFRLIPFIISLIVSFVASIILGILFSGQDFLTPSFWIFALIGSVLAAITYGAIASRGFKTVKKSLLISGIAFALVITVFLCFATGGFGFETKIPKEEDIKEAFVSFSGEQVTFKENELALVTTLHSDLVDGKGNSEEFLRYVNIDYTLKNGSQLHRAYYLTESFGADALFDIYTSQTRIEQIKATLNKAAAKGYLEFTYYNIPKENSDEFNFNKTLTSTDFKTLGELYKKEIKNITKEEMVATFGYHKDTRQIHLSIREGKDETGYRYEGMTLYIYDSMSETIEFLEALPNVKTE